MLEVDGSGNQKGRNIYGTNLLMRTAKDDNTVNQSYYYMYNGHADVTALINTATGSVAATYYYDAFGNIDPDGTTGDVNNNITFAGYQYDSETGLYYCNARMYDPKIARFLSEDTYCGDVSDPLSLNLYTYCANNPLVYYDPTGNTYVPLEVPEEYRENSKNKDSVWRYDVEWMLQTTEKPYKPNYGQIFKDAMSEMASDAWNWIKNIPGRLSSSNNYDSAVDEPKVKWFDRNEEAWDALEGKDPRVAYRIQYEISEETRNNAAQAVGEGGSFLVGFTPFDVAKDGYDFYKGEDSFTHKPMNRLVMGITVVTPEILDKPILQIAKRGTKNAIEESTEAGIKKEVKTAGGSDLGYKVSDSRKTHILEGNGPKDPGHGPNRGFTFGAFPDTWTDDQAISAIEDIANSPNSKWRQSTGPGYIDAPITVGGPDTNAPKLNNFKRPVRFEVTGRNHGLNITVIVEPNGGGIITGYSNGK